MSKKDVFLMSDKLEGIGIRKHFTQTPETLLLSRNIN